MNDYKAIKEEILAMLDKKLKMYNSIPDKMSVEQIKGVGIARNFIEEFFKEKENANKDLEYYISNFNSKMEEASDARSELMGYIEENYDIDTNYESEYLEDNLTWVYGINEEHLNNLINREKEI